MTRASNGVRNWLVGLVAVTVTATGLPVLTAPAAHAQAAPPATVTADSLPTVQVNGVVYDQLIVGNRVYVTGEFTSARPAGAAAGTNETPRSNILAYDLSTGALITSWSPSLNARGYALDVSADGSRIYVGGNFVTVNGVSRYRMAALDATTGTLVTGFNAVFNTGVRAMDVVGDTIYVGGAFSTVNNQPRSRVAAVTSSAGALLPWAPTVDNDVFGVVAPDGSNRVVVSGKLEFANGQRTLGLAVFNQSDAALQPWGAYGVFPNYGTNSAIYSLSTNGSVVFGTGYDFGGPSPFEGSFAADLGTGNLLWVNGCKGDTYASAPVGGAFYSVGHPHDCGMVQGHPQENPWTFQRAMATTVTAAADGRVNTYGAYAGRPAPELLPWLPTYQAGTYTGQTQAAWAVTGNDEYVVIGGEFPRVNGIAQQGLSRFRVNGPHLERPQGGEQLAVTTTALGPGAVRLSWQAAWDRDDRRLTYEVLRGATLAGSTVVGTLQLDSAWWNRPRMAFTDVSAPAGTSQTYRIRVSDPYGNTNVGPAATGAVPAGSTAANSYRDAVLADGPNSYWPLGEASGTTGYNWSGSADLVLAPEVQRGTPGVLAGDPSSTFTGAGTVPAAGSAVATAPQTYSVEAWFRTTSTAGGKIVGFGNSTTGDSGSYDRHIYMTSAGKLVFGNYPGGVRTVASTTSFNDGGWHHVVGTLGSTGMTLYVDGQVAGQRADTTSAQPYDGVWRIGGDSLGGWPDQPSTTRFSGAIDEVAVYPSVLSQARVQVHYQQGGGQLPNVVPSAAFSATSAGLTVSVDGTGSTDPDGSVVSHGWTFGDGSNGTGATTTHTYQAAGTYTVTLTATDDDGATATTSQQVTVTAPPPNSPPTAAFSTTSNGLGVSLDGTGSSDPDGSVVSHGWTFGDGSNGTGATTTHTYQAAGTYTVTLTATDDDGATATTSQQVTVTAPPQQSVIGRDAFGRTVVNGFGAAEVGGSWTVAGGSTSFAVNGGVGRIAVPSAGQSRSAYLNAAGSNVETRMTVTLDKVATGGGNYLTVVGRRVGTSEYRAKIRYLATGAVSVQMASFSGGAETLIGAAVTVPGLTYTAGAPLQIAMRATGTGTTTLTASVWAAGTPEPAAPLLSRTDTTAALQAAGSSVGVTLYLSGTATNAPVVALVDDVVVRDLGQQP